MSWNLRDCRMVGSVCSLRSSAPFSRDAVVLTNERHPGTHMIRGREHADGSVEGETMTEAEWRDLLECEEALAFSGPIEAGPNAKCLLLLETFPEREQAAGQLRACTDAILHEEAREGVLIFVVDESRAADELDRWSRAAFDHAWRLGQQGEWDRALEQADLAWLTDLALGLDRVALLALATERAQGASAAEDLIVFELNSRRGRPEPELRALIAGYRLQFYLAQRLAPRLAVRMHELQSRNSIGDVERWKAERAKTDRVFPFPRAVGRVPAQRSA
jgi:hypothetical protein